MEFLGYHIKEKAADDSVLGDGSDTPRSESSHFALFIILFIFALGAVAYIVRKKKKKGKTTFASRNGPQNKIEKRDQENSKFLIDSLMN